jgi:hypothetical protein
LNDDFAASFTNVYERKTFILGLTSAFNAEVMPPSMQTHLLKIIQQIIAMLNKLKEQEAKSMQKAAKKEIKASENDDEDDEDEEGDSEEEDDYEDADEDDHMHEDEEAKHSDPEEDGATGGGGPSDSTKRSKWTTEADEEEEKGGNGGLGFVDNDEEDGDLDDDDDDEEEELDEAFDLNVTMDMLNAPFKKADEFGYFNSHFRSLYDRDMTYINNLVAQMNEVEKKFLQEFMETKRIKITN